MNMLMAVFFSIFLANFAGAQPAMLTAPQKMDTHRELVTSQDKQFATEVVKLLRSWQSSQTKRWSGKVEVHFRTPAKNESSQGNLIVDVIAIQEATNGFVIGQKSIALWKENGAQSAVLYIAHAINRALGVTLLPLPAPRRPKLI